MTEESEQMLLLLQELAMLRKADKATGLDAATRRKRTKEIKQQMKQLARDKRQED